MMTWSGPLPKQTDSEIFSPLSSLFLGQLKQRDLVVAKSRNDCSLPELSLFHAFKPSFLNWEVFSKCLDDKAELVSWAGHPHNGSRMSSVYKGQAQWQGFDISRGSVYDALRAKGQ
jgi:hypothetical protein